MVQVAAAAGVSIKTQEPARAETALLPAAARPGGLGCPRTVTQVLPLLRPMPSSHATHLFLRQILHPFWPSTQEGFPWSGLAVAAWREAGGAAATGGR